MSENTWKNTLYYGDNLKILRDYIPDESVDLIYLDPPFNSKADYNILFGEKNGTRSQAQLMAFEDTWYWGDEPEATYYELVTSGPTKLADLIQALRQFLGQNDMMAYLVIRVWHRRSRSSGRRGSGRSKANKHSSKNHTERGKTGASVESNVPITYTGVKEDA